MDSKYRKWSICNTPPLTSNTNYTVTGTTAGCSNTAIAAVTIKPVPGNPVLTLSNDTLNCNVVIAGRRI